MKGEGWGGGWGVGWGGVSHAGWGRLVRESGVSKLKLCLWGAAGSECMVLLLVPHKRTLCFSKLQQRAKCLVL